MRTRTTIQHVLLASLTVALVLAATSLPAATVTWSGASGNNWSTDGNWYGGAKPAAADFAIFDATSQDDCNIDQSVSIRQLELRTGFPDTLTQNANPITLASNAVFQAGTFVGGGANFTINDAFFLSGTTFTAPSATLSTKWRFSITGGSFTHNNGTVEFGQGAHPSYWTNENGWVTSGGTVFNDVRFSPSANWHRSLTDDMTILGDLYHINGHSDAISAVSGLASTSTIYLAGDFIAPLTIGYSFPYNGRINIELNGAGDQALSNNNGNTQAFFQLNKGGGDVKMLSNFKCRGLVIPAGHTFDTSPDSGTTSYDLTVQAALGLTYCTFTNAGTFYARGGSHIYGDGGNAIVSFYNTGTYDPGTSDTTFTGNGFGGAGGNQVPLMSGGTEFNDVTIAMSANHYRKLLDDMAVNGDLAVTGGNFRPDTTAKNLYLRGNFSQSSVYTFGNSANFTLVMDGTPTQTMQMAAGNYRANLVVTNAATVALATNLLFTSASRRATVAAGSTLDLAGYDFTVQSGTTWFDLYGTLRLQGDESTVTVPTLHAGSTVAYYGIDGTPVTVANWSYQGLTLDGPGREFQFTGGATYTAAEAFTANGDGTLMLLRSTDGSQWNLDVTAATTVDAQWVDVQDSISVAPTVITAYNSVDSGDNVRWFFYEDPKGTTIILH